MHHLMTRNDLPIPGLLWGDYPEHRPEPPQASERVAAALQNICDRAGDMAATVRNWQDRDWVAQVQVAQTTLSVLDDATALARVHSVLLREGLQASALIQALALTSQAAQRHLGLQPFHTQLIAARAVLNNQLAEMATGEGKTLAVALAATAGALAGMPVHVITANDYLVARDAKRLQPMAHALGLSVGCVVQVDEPAARASAYACDITYVTAKELVFDYLRDTLSAAAGTSGSASLRPRRDALAAPLARLQTQETTTALLRGLCMAVVDEADAILIDEARVPLILSQSCDTTQSKNHAAQALRYARTLNKKIDFELNHELRTAKLTDAGKARLSSAAASLVQACASPAWHNSLHREHAITTALTALYMYQPDRHYLVQDGKVQIIDEITGRVAQGRVWSNGLQQLIEIKENCEPSPVMVTMAQLTYQRFFPRYLRLGGLSGTLREARSELLSTYGLSVRRVALRKRCKRHVGPTRLYRNHSLMWAAVVSRVGELHRVGRPVLVATDSVAEAQELAQHLSMHALPHSVLHARNDDNEAQVVAQAGQHGAITVTTNISGRGTDIELESDVRSLGGLHVISCQLNSAARIDRQLAGRAARQGDAGSVETMLSLETVLLARALPSMLRMALQGCAISLPSWAIKWLARWPQASEEKRQKMQRQRLVEHDERTEKQLSFVGAAE
jgi:preprotein translocase subunit SecA